MDLKNELDFVATQLSLIQTNKNYWMIRTDGGSFYPLFRERGIVALQHGQIPLSFIHKLNQEFKKDYKSILKSIKDRVFELVTAGNAENQTNNKRESSLISSQIFKFVYEVKKGDYVVVPSENSEFISFGVVSENYLVESNPGESGFVLKKEIDWLREIRRSRLDPFLIRMFTAHQAIVDVNKYSVEIERSINDFFILNDYAHLILEIHREHEIPAADLFGLGTEILRLIDDFAKLHNLEISSNDFEVTINLNSPGKIDLKSKIKKTTIIATVLLFVFGGGLETKNGFKISTTGIPAIIDAIDKYKTHQLERDMSNNIFETYKDSLKITTPEDLVKLLKQVSVNKDIAK